MHTQARVLMMACVGPVPFAASANAQAAGNDDCMVTVPNGAAFNAGTGDVTLDGVLVAQ